MADKPEMLGDAPIEIQYKQIMNGLARAVDNILNGHEKPKKTGFILMIFPFDNHGGRCNYISNANREDVVIMLKEQVKRFEGMPEATGHG